MSSKLAQILVYSLPNIVLFAPQSMASYPQVEILMVAPILHGLNVLLAKQILFVACSNVRKWDIFTKNVVYLKKDFFKKIEFSYAICA